MGRGEPLCQVLQPGGNLSCQVDHGVVAFQLSTLLFTCGYIHVWLVVHLLMDCYTLTVAETRRNMSVTGRALAG